MEYEFLRREFYEDWLFYATREQVIDKLIQNDERAKRIIFLENELRKFKSFNSKKNKRR